MDREDAIALQRLLAVTVQVLELIRRAVIAYARHIERKHNLLPISTKQ